MCREITHFYSLNKCNGQETYQLRRSSSLCTWAREVRRERWGNDSVDRWPEFRSPEKHPQPQCRRGWRAKTEGSQELTAQRAAELWLQWETGTHRKPKVESGTGRSSSWRVTSTSAHINSFSSSPHSPTKHNKYDLYTPGFGFCEGTEVHNQQNTGNDVFRTESSGKWNFSFSRKNKGGFLKI